MKQDKVKDMATAGITEDDLANKSIDEIADDMRKELGFKPVKDSEVSDAEVEYDLLDAADDDGIEERIKVFELLEDVIHAIADAIDAQEAPFDSEKETSIFFKDIIFGVLKGNDVSELSVECAIEREEIDWKRRLKEKFRGKQPVLGRCHLTIRLSMDGERGTISEVFEVMLLP